ncbi:MAG: MarR family transcriptional regulator [Candidatus Omnitrophica bacterium]|jgi:DNA-binding MarR family transcriptional regulator|nr:MarR family transcriptional regulator [Candidatus Omnitrophota bacterium]MDD5660264.1 MarR family transcriptional regulator [Candidatus Omnitrophota bacterium]
MTGISITDFARKIEIIMPEIVRGFARRQHDDIFKGKITLPQLLILDILNTQGPSKMTDLAKKMKVTTAASTGIVQRLVVQGYVTREYDEKDRRLIMIKISAKGSEMLKKINQQRTQQITRIFRQISEGDRSEYLRILLQVKDILDKEEE